MLLSHGTVAWRVSIGALIALIILPIVFILVDKVEDEEDIDLTSSTFDDMIPRYDRKSPTSEEWELTASYRHVEEELKPEAELQILYEHSDNPNSEPISLDDTAAGTGTNPETPVVNMDSGRKEKDIKEEDIISYIELGDSGLSVKRYETLFDYPGPPPAVIFVHGGGWVTGKPDLSPSTFMNRVIGAVIFALDFRVDNQFPIQFNDCLRATKYILQHTEELNIDPNKIYIIGGSSGGNLVAAVTTAIGKEPANSFPKLKAQILVNPLLQAIDFSTPSFQNNNSEVTHVTREKVIGMWTMYAVGRDLQKLQLMKRNRHVPAVVIAGYRHTVLDHTKLPQSYFPPRYTPSLPGMDVDKETWNEMSDILLDDRYAPLMAESFGNLPPTFIYVGYKDVVRDDSEFYMMQLKAAGVRVEYVMDTEGFHGSFWLYNPKQLKLYVQISEFLNSV